MEDAPEIDNRHGSTIIQIVDRGIGLFENVLGDVLVIGVVVVVLMQIVFRFILGQPLSWSTETACNLLIWITMVGLAIAQREGAHVAMRVLPKMPAALQRTVNWTCWLSSVAMYFLLGFGGLELAMLHHVQRSPATGLPIWVVYCALPLGGVLGLWHTFKGLPELLRGK